MQVLADYIHNDGLKFGIYLTPGIPRQAVLLNTPIQGTSYHAQDIVKWTPATPTITAISATNPAVITTSAAHGLSSSESVMVNITSSNSSPSINGIYPETYIDTTHFSIPVAVTTAGTAGTYSTPFTEYNYNQGVMYRIDFTKPGAQEYYNSLANRFASWGVDYVKFDGVRTINGTDTGNAPDVQAMSKALQQTGRPIVLDDTQGSQQVGIAANDSAVGLCDGVLPGHRVWGRLWWSDILVERAESFPGYQRFHRLDAVCALRGSGLSHGLRLHRGRRRPSGGRPDDH